MLFYLLKLHDALLWPIYALFGTAFRICSWILEAIHNPIGSATGVVAYLFTWLWQIMSGQGITLPPTSSVVNNNFVNLTIPILRFLDVYLPVSEFIWAVYACIYCVFACLVIRLILLVYSLIPAIGKQT